MPRLRHAPVAIAGALLVAAVGCGGSGSEGPAQGPVDPGSSSVAHHHASGLVSRASWTQSSEGYRLHVTPSASGRAHAAGLPAQALADAIHLAAPTPTALGRQVRASLLNQLKCHAVFARSKPQWNLEAWRPDVGYLATVAALCNP